MQGHPECSLHWCLLQGLDLFLLEWQNILGVLSHYRQSPWQFDLPPPEFCGFTGALPHYWLWLDSCRGKSPDKKTTELQLLKKQGKQDTVWREDCVDGS